MTERLRIRRPDDWHLHVRDGAMLTRVVPYTAAVFRRAIIMPNLVPPITTAEQVRAYRARILAAAGPRHFQPLMTCYLTESLEPDALARAYEDGDFIAAKLYPAGATTNSDQGVRDVANIAPVLRRMQDIGMPLLIHGEVTDADVDVFDREEAFIERVLRPLVAAYPSLRIVLEHVTSAAGVAFVQSAPETVAATITPHHLMINRNALFQGGIRPHHYCLPITKTETDRRALRKAATSGNRKFFLGTDSAPHARHDKECACGKAGIFNAMDALGLYVQVFEEEHALDRLDLFTSLNGPMFYDLPVNLDTVVLEKGHHRVPDSIDTGPHQVVPFMAGETIPWRVVSVESAA